MEIKKINIQENPIKVVDFIRESSRSNYSTEIFNWQYMGEKCLLYSIEDQNEIVGTQGMIELELVESSQKILTHKSETTFLNPKYRGQGLFEKIYEKCVHDVKEKKSKLIWGFTALGTLWEKKLNFNYVSNIISEATLVVNNIGEFQSRLKKVFYFLKKLQLKILLLYKSNSIKYNSKECKKFKNFDFIKKINDFYGDQAIYLNYNSKSVMNRVFESPIISYELLEIYDGNKIKAALVFHIEKRTLYISDIFYARNINFNSLVKEIYVYANLKNVNFIKFWGNNTNPKYSKIFNLFKKFGARVETDINMQLIYKSFSDFQTSNQFKNYFINGLWTEGYNY